MKYTPFLLLLFFLPAIISCKKDKLTKETQNGANTFSCLIDGEIYKPCSEAIIGGANVKPVWGGLYVSNGITQASIVASCSEGVDWSISINIGNLVGKGEYSFSDPSNRAVFTVYKYNTGNYSSSNTGKGKVTITKDDRANNILSGIFEFEGVDINNTGKIIMITSGRFDINYKK
ncbi:MAG: DUF6252 family protein [Agriterribacter sp.]